MNFKPGTPVMTSMGRGEVVFSRMAPPTYSEPEAYSIKLDSRKTDPTYNGTMFPASEVTACEEKSMTPLYGHTSEDTAYLVEDYPYGRLRCKIKFWLEHQPRKGWRFVSQTENPKNGRWNNPRKGTYYVLGGCMYLDEKGHVQASLLSEYAKPEEILKFLESFPNADTLTIKAYVIGRKAVCKRKAEGNAVISIGGVPQTPNESEIEDAKKEIEILDKCYALLGLKSKEG
jgi:hypothetical protein